jgi:hypothetical protein
MLAGKKAGEVLTRLLADPNRFLENGELEEADWEPPQPGQSTALSRDVRLLLAIANLKVSLAKQQKALGSN